ncbi:MAG TPA: CMD domain protein [Roseiarcus sp.]|jgi:CMD domain protein
MTRFAADVIDSVLGVSEGSPLHQLRARRLETRARTQSSYAVLFNPPDPGGLSPPERFAVALRVAELHDALPLAAHYRARLADEAGGRALAAAIDSGAPSSGVTPRVEAMLRHADLVTLNPSAASDFVVEPLEAEGLTAAEIVTLSQIIAFVAYQVRVAASLALIAETP